MKATWKQSASEFADRVKKESRDRGWLFSVVSGWCMAFGLLCILLAAIVAIKSAFGPSATAESIVRLFVAGGVIVVSTAYMWNFNVWGRNIAVASVACLSWVVAEAISRRIGAGISTQVLTAAFVGMAISCFTSPTVRAMFAKAEELRASRKEEAQ